MKFDMWRPDSPENRAELFRDFLKWLPQFQGVVPWAARPAGNGVWLIDNRNPRSERRHLWVCADNGDELTLERPNLDPYPVDVPYTAHGFLISGPTLAYRVACLLRGDPIDYTEDMSDCLSVPLTETR